MLQLDERSKKAFDEAAAFAEKLGGKALESWNYNVNFLREYRGGECVCILYPEHGSPFCFDFALYVKNKDDTCGAMLFNGGLIFHGKHDGGGDGSAPTFCVSMGSLNGDTEARWEIHT